MRWSEPILFPVPLRDVRLVGDRVVDEMEERLRQHEQLAYERGLADGEKALHEQLVQQRTEVATLQQGVLDSLRQTIPQVVHQSESALIELALRVAQKLVDDLPISVEMVEANLRAAIAQAEEGAECFIQLHPEDLALIEKHDSGLLTPEPGKAKLHLESSNQVSRGGCLVQTRFGVVDARRETKMERLRQSLPQ